jgi:hypothetical protein
VIEDQGMTQTRIKVQQSSDILLNRIQSTADNIPNRAKQGTLMKMIIQELKLWRNPQDLDSMIVSNTLLSWVKASSLVLEGSAITKIAKMESSQIDPGTQALTRTLHLLDKTRLLQRCMTCVKLNLLTPSHSSEPPLVE